MSSLARRHRGPLALEYRFRNSNCLVFINRTGHIHAMIMILHNSQDVLGVFLLRTCAASTQGTRSTVTNCLTDPVMGRFAEEVKAGLSAHFAETYEDVYKLAFDYDDAEAAAVGESSEQGLQGGVQPHVPIPEPAPAPAPAA